MIRIISGKYKRRHLNAPPGGNVRPTSDRTKTALFNVLGTWIQEKKVLDLFAGSGSVGYECISRGAKHITFVERNPTAVKFIAANVKELEETENIDICAKDVFKFLFVMEIENQKSEIKKTFDFIYADPPFKNADIISLLKKISLSEITNENSIIVIEHEKKKEIIEGEIYSGFECYKTSKYGKAVLSYFKLKF